MKKTIILLTLGLFLVTSFSFAQKDKEPKNIITGQVGLKYHKKSDLERMNKGEMLDLYVKRIEILVHILPYIAFATKPGVTMSTLGIPNDKDNREALDEQHESATLFLNTNEEFQKRILPYSDKSDLIAAILFYEEIVKSIHSYAEFH